MEVYRRDGRMQLESRRNLTQGRCMLFVYETAVSARQHEELTSSKVQTRIDRAEPAVQEKMALRAYGSCCSRKNFRKAPGGM
jgi:hypothetical protein